MSLAVLILELPCQMQASTITLRHANQPGVDLSSSLSGAWSPLPFMAQSVETAQRDERGMFGGGMKAVGSLLLVLSIIFAIAFLLRRYLPCYFGITGKIRLVQIVETVSLGDKKSLTLVRVGSDRLLLGCTPNSISVLEKIQFPVGDVDQAPSQSGGELEFESGNQESDIPGFKRSLHSFKNWRGNLKQNRCGLPGHEASAGDLSFGEILDQKAEESSTPSNDSPSGVISRLAEIRRNLQAR
jgi:flagellar biosynthetic protein FliO